MRFSLSPAFYVSSLIYLQFPSRRRLNVKESLGLKISCQNRCANRWLCIWFWKWSDMSDKINRLSSQKGCCNHLVWPLHNAGHKTFFFSQSVFENRAYVLEGVVKNFQWGNIQHNSWSSMQVTDLYFISDLKSVTFSFQPLSLVCSLINTENRIMCWV